MPATLVERRPAPQPAAARTGEKRQKAVVVGAGAFGGWTARDLQRSGYAVTLVDAWGPANSRASSGDESRLIRAVYGADAASTRNTARAMKLWRGLGEESGETLCHETGVLWLAGEDDSYVRDSLPALQAAGLEAETLEVDEARRRWPQIDFEGVRTATFEPEAGFLLARRACQAVLKLFLQRGGRYVKAEARPGPVRGGRMEAVELSDGTRLSADVFVFACGPWLGPLFRDVVGERIRPTRQEVFYFGVPPGRAEFSVPTLPVWVDLGPKRFYGVPEGGHHGFKIADDTRGPRFDPTLGERLVSVAAVDAARKLLARRFPDLKDAPLLEARVCQYEETFDRRFLLDRHPEARNALLLGGGSGHGFKQAPVVGEIAAAVAAGRRDPPEGYSLARLG